MPEPNVLIREIDLSNRVPIPPGIAAAFPLTAKKGPWNPKGNANRGIGIPTLISNDEQLYRTFGTPDASSDPNYFSALNFLKDSNAAWVIRAGKGAVNAPTFVSAVVLTGTATYAVTGAGGTGVPTLVPGEPVDNFIIDTLSATTYQVLRESNGAVVDAGPFTYGVDYDGEVFASLRITILTGTPVAGNDLRISYTNSPDYLLYAGARYRNQASAQAVQYFPDSVAAGDALELGVNLLGSTTIGSVPFFINPNQAANLYTINFLSATTYEVIRQSDNVVVATGLAVSNTVVQVTDDGLSLVIRTSDANAVPYVYATGDTFVLFMGGTAVWEDQTPSAPTFLAVSRTGNVNSTLHVYGADTLLEPAYLEYGIDTIQYILEVVDISPVAFSIRRADTNQLVTATPLTFDTDYLNEGPFQSVHIGVAADTALVAFALGDKFDIYFTLANQYAWNTNLAAPAMQLPGTLVQPYDFSPAILPSGDSTLDAIIIYAKNPGVWGNGLSFRIRTDTRQNARKKDGTNINSGTSKGAYIIAIEDSGTLVEEWAFATYKDAVDGFGRSAFMPTILNQSQYISAEVSDEVASDPDFILAVSTSIEYTLAGGRDSSYLDVTDKLASLGEALEEINDPDMYEVALIPLGFHTAPVDTPVSPTSYPFNTTLLGTALEIARNREDCVVLGSLATEAERSSNIFDESDPNTVSVANNISALQDAVGSLGSYLGVYSSNLIDSDSNVGALIDMSADSYVARAISNDDVNFTRWASPAGTLRGGVPAISLVKRYTKAERDVLYERNVNPIYSARNAGIYINGDRTMQNRISSLSQIGTRIMLTVLKPQVRGALANFLFEVNIPQVRDEVKAIMESIVSRFVAGRGITEYLVVCDERNNPASVVDQQKLIVWIFVKPVSSINFIEASIIITRSGVDLEALANSGVIV